MSFAVLALVCTVALFASLLHLRPHLPIPVVVCELMVGMVLGRSGFHLLNPDNETFAFLAEVGFVLVMFVAGTHVPVREPALLAGLRVGAARAAAVGALSVPAGWAVAQLFGTGHGMLYAVLFASSSAGIVMPLMAGMPLTGRTMVQLLPQLAIADAACIVLLPLAVNPAQAARSALGALAVIAVALVAWTMLNWLQKSGHRKRIHHVSQEKELAIELRSVLALTFAVAAVAVAFSVSVMLAGFAMGLAVAAVGEPRRVAKQMFAITDGLMGPIFFVWLGSTIMLNDLVNHPQAIGLGLALGAGALAVHCLMVFSGQHPAAAIASASQLGVPVAAATLGTTLGILTPGEAPAMLLGALVTIGATTAVTGALSRIAHAESATPPPASAQMTA